MKKIKFRAWNNRVNELREVLRIFFNENTIEVKNDNSFDGLTWFLDYCDLMQFTGWHDRNNRKIYESDIVKFDNTLIGGIKGVAVIEWVDDFCIQQNPGWIMYNKGYHTHDSFLGSEVIGNIYENPELLKDA